MNFQIFVTLLIENFNFRWHCENLRIFWLSLFRTLKMENFMDLQSWPLTDLVAHVMTVMKVIQNKVHQMEHIEPEVINRLPQHIMSMSALNNRVGLITGNNLTQARTCGNVEVLDLTKSEFEYLDVGTETYFEMTGLYSNDQIDEMGQDKMDLLRNQLLQRWQGRKSTVSFCTFLVSQCI